MRVFLCNKETRSREHVFHCDAIELGFDSHSIKLFNANNNEYHNYDGITRYHILEGHPDIVVLIRKYYIHIDGRI